MTREELITNLKYTMKKHENDAVRTFGTNISAMCKDMLDYLEKETKSEWEQDHTILKAYSDGADEVIDKIRAEIKDWQIDVHDNEYDAESHDFVFERIYEIIDEIKL